VESVVACLCRHDPAVYAQAPLDARLARFARHYRRRLRKLAKGSRPLADLLVSFPAAAVALAAGSFSSPQREEAIRLVRQGKSLNEVAAILHLPLWLRWLPPEAFIEPPAAFPKDEAFGRHIVNFIPADENAAARWLQAVTFALRACDASFALWVAAQRAFTVNATGDPPLLPLAAFAWHSGQPGVAGRALMNRPWHRHMSFVAAAYGAGYWFERVLFDHCAEGEDTGECWRKAREVCGYRFTPLLHPDDLRKEGEHMFNCVATYWEKAARGACLLYSVRRGGNRVATMEIAPCAMRSGAPVIAQLLGPGNRAAGELVWRAASTWLARQGRYPAAPCGLGGRQVHWGRWQEFWRPYRQARPGFGERLAEPGPAALSRLRRQLDELRNLATLI
jgi:hypothetical protein